MQGSVTKSFTAVRALRLVQAGKLDLDAPVHVLVDPWLRAQSPPQPVEHSVSSIVIKMAPNIWI